MEIAQVGIHPQLRMQKEVCYAILRMHALNDSLIRQMLANIQKVIEAHQEASCQMHMARCAIEQRLVRFVPIL